MLTSLDQQSVLLVYLSLRDCGPGSGGLKRSRLLSELVTRFAAGEAPLVRHVIVRPDKVSSNSTSGSHAQSFRLKQTVLKSDKIREMCTAPTLTLSLCGKYSTSIATCLDLEH